MKKRSNVKNIIGLLLSGVIVFAGIMIPRALLNWQEMSIVGDLTNVAIADRNLVEPSMLSDAQQDVDDSVPTPTPVLAPLSSKLSVDELYAHLFIWDMDGYKTLREPFDDELSMDNVVERTRTTIGGLAAAGMLSSHSWSDYRLTDAQLEANIVPLSQDETYKIIGGVVVPSNFGRWTLEFDSKVDNESLTVICDAITGTVYEITVKNTQLPSDIENVLGIFASYYAVADDGGVTVDADQIISDRFVISYTPSNIDAYTVSIRIKN